MLDEVLLLTNVLDSGGVESAELGATDVVTMGTVLIV